MDESRYKGLAKAVKGLFMTEFGEFSRVDFERTVHVIREEDFHGKPYAVEVYEGLSSEEKDQIDFMMKL